MCFSVNVNLVKDELESRYGTSFPEHDRYQPSYYYHAFGLPDLPVICSGSSETIQLFKWGLIPSWVKDIEDANVIRYKTFNARAETINTKPSFSASFKSKRCIIPVKGFFEWQHIENEKIPWYVYHIDNQIFSIAGLYEQWVESRTGEVYNTFSLITTDANDLMAMVHNTKKRMPAILDDSAEKKWLNLSTTSAGLLELLKPCPEGVLKAHTVSKLVNDRSVNRNTPDVIRPYEYKSNNQLF